MNAAPYLAPLYTAKVIKFPECRSEIARLRAEVEEIRKTVSVMVAVGT